MRAGEPMESTWAPSKIEWVPTEGSKGPYERYPASDQKAEATEDYKAMLADLKKHNDRMTLDGFFYWVFQDGATVGRKLRKGKAPEPQAAKTDVETVKSKFPSELADLLTFEVEGQFVVLKPKKFLGSENFAKIAAIVREIKGEYVSVGKQSHFKVPLKK